MKVEWSNLKRNGLVNSSGLIIANHCQIKATEMVRPKEKWLSKQRSGLINGE